MNENLRIYNVLKHKRLKRTTYIYPEQRYHKSANHIHCPRANGTKRRSGRLV